MKKNYKYYKNKNTSTNTGTMIKEWNKSKLIMSKISKYVIRKEVKEVKYYIKSY